MELNTIYNQDCLQGLKQLPDNCVDLVVTDPPYVLSLQGAGIYKRKLKYHHDLEDITDGFRPEILDELVRVMKRINCYFFCSQAQILPLLKYFHEDKGCYYTLLTWHKDNPVPACGNSYLNDTEYILFFREKGVPIYGTYDTKHRYYVTHINSKDKTLYGHPTCKPVDILQNFIVNSSLENDIVLDPFMGSGSTAIAAINTQRQYLGYEINPEYYDTAIRRIKGLTRRNENELTLFDLNEL